MHAIDSFEVTIKDKIDLLVHIYIWSKLKTKTNYYYIKLKINLFYTNLYKNSEGEVSTLRKYHSVRAIYILTSLLFQTAFDDVLAEVEGTHSIDCIWKASYACFHGCKSCCYNIFTFFCGICVAIFWGLDFAVIAFAHVWFVTPFLRICMIHCNLCQKTFGTWVNCCCAPCCEVFSLVFSNIRVEKK